MNESYYPHIVQRGVEDALARQARGPNSSADPSRLFSQSLEKFVAEQVGSVEQLEILLYMFRSPSEWWSSNQVYEAVKSNVRSVQERLAHFCSQGILHKDCTDPPCYRAKAEDAQLARLVTELDGHYRERRVRVVELIYARVPSGVTEFARAFRIRKGES
jgi:hypothetical protein